MTMPMRRHSDPLDQLVERTRQLYDELRIAAVDARRAAAAHQTAAADQQETASALAPEENDDA